MLKKICKTLIQIIIIIIIVTIFIMTTRISWWFLKLAYNKLIEAFSMI